MKFNESKCFINIKFYSTGFHIKKQLHLQLFGRLFFRNFILFIYEGSGQIIFTSLSSSIPNFSFTESIIIVEKSKISFPVAFPVAFTITRDCN